MGLITETNQQYYQGAQGFRGDGVLLSFTTTFDTNLILGSWNPNDESYALNNFKLYTSTSGLPGGYVEYTTAFTVVNNAIVFPAGLEPAIGLYIVVQLKLLSGGKYGSTEAEKAYGEVVEDNYGSYEYIKLSDAVDNFMVGYVGDGKILQNTKKSDVLFFAKRSLQEFSYDIFKSVKAQEIEVPNTLKMILPQDYVNYSKVTVSGTDGIAPNTAAVAETFSGDGIYSNAGVDFTMTGATDNGITFSATVNFDTANTEIDTGDFELDAKDGGAAGLGAVSMSGTFGTLTFDEAGIDNLYSDATTHDMSYSTTVGAVALTVAHSVGALAADTDYAKATSFSAGYTASGMAFTLLGSETAAGTSASLAMSYALNDTVTITADTDQVAGAESVQTIGASTTLNGVSVSVESANNSTWDVDLGYSAGGFALTYGVDETDHWTATATAALGGGATFATGVSSDNEMYAGVSFAF